MHQHGETFKVNHEFLLLTTVKNLKEKSNEGEVKLKEKETEIEQLKELNTTKDETLKEMKLDFENLKVQFENVRTELTTKIERNEEQTKEINEKQTRQSDKIDQFKEDINNLQTFAETTSKLHFTLSEKLFRRNHHYNSTLFQEKYDKDKNVIGWNEMIKNANLDYNECEYLKTLKVSLNQFKATIYSLTYKERLENFCFSTPQGNCHGPFIRIGCSCNIKSICVKIFDTYEHFEKEVEKNDKRRSCKVQNSDDVCSYYVGDCLHVLMYYVFVDRLYLLHNLDEEEKVNLPNGKEIRIGDILDYIVAGESIVLHLSSIFYY